jgi:hypothetical protein
MPRRDPPPTLWDYNMLSHVTGIPVNTLRQWKWRGKLPEPDLETASGPAWWAETIAPLAARIAVEGGKAVALPAGGYRGRRKKEGE